MKPLPWIKPDFDAMSLILHAKIENARELNRYADSSNCAACLISDEVRFPISGSFVECREMIARALCD